MKEKKTNKYYLEHASIPNAIAYLAIPMMIGMSVGTIYNVINAFFIGMLHDTAMLTAVTLGLPIFTILMAIGNMLGAGGGTFITRLIAKQEGNRARKVAGYIFYESIILGILVTILAILTLDTFTKLLGADTQPVIEYTKQYSLVIFLGAFSVILNFSMEQMVRAEGASKESMYGMFISTVLNLIFDPLFILVLNLNVTGVALALIFSNLGSSLYYFYYLNWKSEHLRGFIKFYKISIKDKIEIYKIGVSELLLSLFLIITTLLSNHYSIEYGDSVVAGFGIVLRIVQIPEFLSMGLALGVIPLIAYNFSNGNIRRLKGAIMHTTCWILLLSGTFVTLTGIFRTEVLHRFTTDIEVLKVGTIIMLAMLISALFNGVTTLFTGIFQAAGQGIASIIMSITQGVLFIPVIICLHQLYGLNGVIWSMTVTEIITCLVGVVLYILFYLKLSKNEIEKVNAE